MNKSLLTTIVAAKKVTHYVDAKGKKFYVESARVNGNSIVLMLSNRTALFLDNADYTTSEMSTDRGVTFFTPKFESISLYW